jgi:hypothetical protein
VQASARGAALGRRDWRRWQVAIRRAMAVCHAATLGRDPDRR